MEVLEFLWGTSTNVQKTARYHIVKVDTNTDGERHLAVIYLELH